VVAGGSGSRFGGPKQFAELRGRSLIDWSLAAARAVADGIVLVVPAGDVDELRASANSAGADAVVAGGERRADSVRAGLAAVPEDAAVVVVHDGARPLAPASLFASVVEAVAGGADAAIPGVAVTDTLKQVEDDAVVATVARDGLVAVQTPQAFRAALLRRAHAAGDDATDDAALVEALGATVRVVPGDPRNVKVTDRSDLDLADALAGS
jgi:2-C-methyl-D-erythritol 4-phosphate cytidylyltransferase